MTENLYTVQKLYEALVLPKTPEAEKLAFDETRIFKNEYERQMYLVSLTSQNLVAAIKWLERPENALVQDAAKMKQFLEWKQKEFTYIQSQSRIALKSMKGVIDELIPKSNIITVGQSAHIPQAQVIIPIKQVAPAQQVTPMSNTVVDAPKDPVLKSENMNEERRNKLILESLKKIVWLEKISDIAALGISTKGDELTLPAGLVLLDGSRASSNWEVRLEEGYEVKDGKIIKSSPTVAPKSPKEPKKPSKKIPDHSHSSHPSKKDTLVSPIASSPDIVANIDYTQANADVVNLKKEVAKGGDHIHASTDGKVFYKGSVFNPEYAQITMGTYTIIWWKITDNMRPVYYLNTDTQKVIATLSIDRNNNTQNHRETPWSKVRDIRFIPNLPKTFTVQKTP